MGRLDLPDVYRDEDDAARAERVVGWRQSYLDGTAGERCDDAIGREGVGNLPPRLWQALAGKRTYTPGSHFRKVA